MCNKRKITEIGLNHKYQDKQRMMELLAQENFIAENALQNPEILMKGLSSIDSKVKKGENLSFEEAFSGMAFVVMATNSLLRKAFYPKMSFPEAVAKGSAFLQLMATKEALKGLSSEEIAGMVASGMMDLVFKASIPEIVETCGMGGDRGWNGTKTINASTLSAIVLASLEIPTFKHGSYGNTSKIGSTDIPMSFGANICQNSKKEVLDLFQKTNFWFSDAHSVKTLHYLSHLLMVETVNHIVGPMTIPIANDTKLSKVIGVNHNVDPEEIAKAYALLHQKGILNLKTAIAVCGLDSRPSGKWNSRWIREHTILDECAPQATLVSISKEGSFIGSFIITDQDFNTAPLDENELKIANVSESLMSANQMALSGKHKTLSKYLARNTALGLMAYSNGEISSLPDYYKECLDAISSGLAIKKLKQYVDESGGKFKSWL